MRAGLVYEAVSGLVQAVPCSPYFCLIQVIPNVELERELGVLLA